MATTTLGGIFLPECLCIPTNAGWTTKRLTSAALNLGLRRNKSTMVARMGIKIRETYDASFELDPERDAMLRTLLSSDVFCKQVAQEAGAAGTEFTGELFQPVPWSPTTQHGMPQEYEKYVKDKENYVIINVPPNYMFKAKVFKPSRLCAVYKKCTTD